MVYQNSCKAIKGSVFEVSRANNNKQDYVVISDTDYNMKTRSAICCLITSATAKDADNEWAVPYDLAVGNMVQHMYILTNVNFYFKASDLKYYKYCISSDIMENVDKKYMNIIFGKRLYSIDECRRVVEEENIKFRVRCENKYESEPTNIDPVTTIQEQIVVVNHNSSIDDEQRYFAMNNTEDNIDIIPIQESEPQPPLVNKSYFNTVLQDFDFSQLTEERVKEEEEKQEESIEEKPKKRLYIDRSSIWENPKAFLKDCNNIDKDELFKKYNISSEKTFRTIRRKAKAILEQQIQENRFIDNKEDTHTLEDNQDFKFARSYTDRSMIWDKPDEFLLDCKTMSREDVKAKYNIVADNTYYSLKEKAKKKCDELNLDYSFLYEKE